MLLKSLAKLPGLQVIIPEMWKEKYNLVEPSYFNNFSQYSLKEEAAGNLFSEAFCTEAAGPQLFPNSPQVVASSGLKLLTTLPL